jgi:2-succinyl-5-enolpyruvyl-6-hydroxy-3-cyclohexene-1-carboxylate synthase
MDVSSLDTRNVNSLWAGVLVETLHRCGVQLAVVSPGSRSTPLTMALARHGGIEAVPVLDERSAGFFALGAAKATGRPVVLVCTSGTAVANYLPAIVEAHESNVPLLVLTADRPPELRDCASGQTIDQLKIFGGYARFFHECALPELDFGRLRYLRQTMAHAVQRTLVAEAGPVHVNLPFRDPLPPIDDGGGAAQFAAGVDWAQFFAHLAPVEVPVPSALVPHIIPEVHGAIIVGPTQAADVASFVGAVSEIARRLGWPVLADPLSPLRYHSASVPTLVTTYDLVLRNPAAAERLKPEAVLCLGGWPTSKGLRSWVEASEAKIWLVNEAGTNRDALHGRTQSLVIAPSALATILPESSEPNGYQRMWARYEEQMRPILDAKLDAESEMFEMKAVWLLAQHLPPETPLFIANSMPVRDAEYVVPGADRHVRPLCNRGANGIDGTLSSALGVAHGTGKPTVLLTGDLALLHDTNGFLLKPKLKTSLTIVLINNRGGGIFDHLPVSQFEPPFEHFFATPQEADFGQLALAYGVEHTSVYDWAHFTDLIGYLPETGIRVLELHTDRKRDAATRRAWFAELGAALGGSSDAG